MIKSGRLNESTYDGDTVNWNKISAGDIVGWTIEGMGRLPKVGDDFRVGPFIGKCTKVSGSKVYMKIESDARELSENMNEAKDTLDSEIIFQLTKLRTEATEALYAYEQKGNLREAKDILTYLVRDSSSTLKEIKSKL